MTYDEKLAAVAEKLGHCRVAGGLDDHDVARQVLEVVGIVADDAVAETVAEPVPIVKSPRARSSDLGHG